MSEIYTDAKSENVSREISVELHYYLKDQSHLLDAFVVNRSQFEFLHLANEIAKALDVSLQMEIYPLEEGGIRQYFCFKDKDVRVGVSVAVVSMVLSTFISNPISQITGEWAKKMFEDRTLLELQRENLRLQNTNLKLDAKLKEIALEKNQKALIHKSRFYKALQTSPKIEKVSIRSISSNKTEIFPERVVLYQDFPEYIIDSNTLPPLDDENADIEIISPVLKQGNYKWRGVYKNVVISFGMKSAEFKRKVLSGEINFKNGFSIKCSLRIQRILDENGEEKIHNYCVTRVDSYFVNDSPVETDEGKRKRLAIKNDGLQLRLPLE